MSLLKAWFARHGAVIVILFFGVLVPLTLFGMLAEDVAEREIFPFDRPLLLFLHAHATPWLDEVMLAATRAGSAWTLVPFNLIVAWRLLLRERRRDAVFWLASTAGAALIDLAAKNAFVRMRPELWVSRVPEVTYSFPSGHAMSTMATVAALCLLLRATRWRWPMAAVGVLFVLAVGVSRMYEGVHYPSDVLAGWMASLAWVEGLALLMRRYHAGVTPIRSKP